eukprot:gene16217-17850_t
MAVVEKMSILGIRSYSPNERSIIEFQTPLTLIVGSNGSGKTTIIECLKYITTGMMPPGSKNSAFVHDPKVACEREVKGQVKLRFTDVAGKRYFVTRIMVSSQKLKKIETKSLDSVIMKEVNGERTSISSRCADMNREMITRLGVSKAVLENVIFCHQEEANWPLSEGKTLKQKFDDIFAATRYIKALESIRSFRKTQEQTIKECGIDLTHLKQKKVKAEEIKNELAETQARMAAATDDIRKINSDLLPIEAKLTEIDAVAEEVFRLEKEIGKHTSTLKQVKKNTSELEEKIENKFQGSFDELLDANSEFSEKIRLQEVGLKKIESNIKRCSVELQDLTKTRTDALMLHGKLEQDAEMQKKRIVTRDKLVESLIDEYDLPVANRGSYSSDFLRCYRSYVQQLEDNATREQKILENELDELTTKINKVTKSNHDFESTIKHKNDSMEENRRKLRQLAAELDSVAASGNRLQGIDRELRKAEKQLEQTASQINVEAMQREEDALSTEKKHLEQTLVELRDEQSRMHLQSTAQTKIDMLVKDKQGKEDSIQHFLSRHDTDLSEMFSSRPALDELKSKLSEYLHTKKADLKSFNERLKICERQLATKETSKKMYTEDVRKMEAKMTEYRERLSDACGENDYNVYREQVKKGVDKYKNILSEIKAFEKIYRKYIGEMKGGKDKGKGCPLCHRKFETSRELYQLMEELEHKLVSVPEKKQQNETFLEQEKEKSHIVEELAPVKSNLDALESKDLPEVRKKANDLGKEVQKLREELRDIEDIRAMTESEERMAREMEPDIRMIDSYQYDIKDLDRQINLEASKLKGIVPGRTMAIIINEIEDVQQKVDSITKQLELKRNHSMENQRQCSVLERSVNELRSEQLDITSKIQRRTQLEDQKADLTSTNLAYERDVKEADRQLHETKRKLTELQGKKTEFDKKKQKHEADARDLHDAVKQKESKLRDLSNEINRYIDDGGDQALDLNSEKVGEIESRYKKLEREKEKLSAQLARLQKDLANEQMRARELEDNIQLFRAEDEIKNVEKKIAGLQKELRRHSDSGNLATQRAALQNRLDALRKDKANCEGRLKGFEEQQHRMQRELRSDMFAGADDKHRKKVIELKTTELANKDLDTYYKALDRAIMKFHSLKMAEINRIIKEYWIHTYRGHDIDTIEIRADEEEGSGAAKSRRTYNYRVVMLKGDTALDMRGRCSAGQKVLASIIIRLALAETFCLNCGILALDEPTTNLDEQNVESLANALKDIISNRMQQRNFQLVVITHDEEFVRALGQSDFVDHFYRVYKDEGGFSKIHRQRVNEVHE